MFFQHSARRAFALPRFSRAASPTVPAHLVDHAATALAGLIADERADTIAHGVRPVPPSVSRALLGFFPEALLRKCRFTIGEHGPIRLPALRLSYGDPGFVTLGDVISFTDEHTAQTDLRAWAHALTHVMQHQRWGAEDFARRVVQDRVAVEQEAIHNAARFMAWRGERRTLGGP